MSLFGVCVRMYDYLRAARAYLIPEQDNIFLDEDISANPLLKYSTVDKIHLGQAESKKKVTCRC